MAPRTPYVRPVEYFETRGVTLERAVLVVLAVVAVNAATLLALAGALLVFFPSAAGPGLLSGSVLSIVVLFASTLLDWVVASAVVHGIALFAADEVDGIREGVDVTDTFALLGVSAGPIAVRAVVRAAVSFVVAAGLVAAGSPTDANSVRAVSATSDLASTFLGVGLYAWLAYVWTGGLQVVHGMDRRNARRTAVAAAVVFLFVSVPGLL